MMKKCMNLRFLFLLVGVLFIPINTDAATANTLADLRAELSKLQSEKSTANNNITMTEAEIAQKNADIAAAYAAIEKAKDDITIAENSIDNTNEEIDELITQAGDMLVLYEQLQNSESYLEYVTGAASITELIMRMDAIEMVLEYNNKVIKDLEGLIVENEALKVTLLNKQTEYDSNIINYEDKIVSLNSDLSSFAEITEDIDDQISNQSKLIDYYEELGCEENQSLTECVEIANNREWMKPVVSGYVTSLFGYRTIWGSYSFHNGIDIGGNSEGTYVYAAAAGTVAAVTYRSSCGGNKVYIHSYVNGEAYTQAFLHLLDTRVKVGDKVTTDTVIGTVGGGSQTWWDSCSTGAHLHFTIATGFYLGAGSNSYSSYSTYVAKSINPPGFPSSIYGRFYSRTDWYD